MHLSLLFIIFRLYFHNLESYSALSTRAKPGAFVLILTVALSR